MTTIPERYTRRTDGQTDRQHTMALTVPLILHGAGKKSIANRTMTSQWLMLLERSPKECAVEEM